MSEVIIDPQEVKADPEAWTCIGAEVTRLIDSRAQRRQPAIGRPDERSASKRGHAEIR